MIASFIRQLNKLPLCSEEPGLGVLNIRKEDNKTNVRWSFREPITIFYTKAA